MSAIVDYLFRPRPRSFRRALKGLFIAVFNVTVFMLLDWRFPAWRAQAVHSSNDFDWAFGLGVFSGYFFWGND